jgi:arabinan endo-1,5-alpha-L-arabinosidase
MVARSRRATGPFETLGRPILEARGRWLAPGHNSVITDDRGRDWIVYHAVDTNRPRTLPGDEINTRRIMLIDRIVWKNGWPVVEGR